MKIKHWIIIALFLVCMEPCHAQQGANAEEVSRPALPGNSMYMEIFGTGRYPSLNYERILLHRGNFFLSSRLGFSYYFRKRHDYYTFKRHYYNVPLVINGIFQVRDHLFIETGIGATQSYFVYIAYGEDHPRERADFSTTWVSACIGLRVQTGGFLFRFALTPMINVTKDYKRLFSGVWSSGYGIDPLAGISLGYSFGK